VTAAAVGRSTATALVGRVCVAADDSAGNDKNAEATSLTNPSSATATSPTWYRQPRAKKRMKNPRWCVWVCDLGFSFTTDIGAKFKGKQMGNYKRKWAW